VQYSAYPDAYAKWEPGATTLVRALDGSDPLRLTCRAGAQVPSPITASRAPAAGSDAASPALASLLAAAHAELGAVTVVSATGGSAVVTASLDGLAADQSARVVAAWLVAHATGDGVTEITVGDRHWVDHGWAAADVAQTAGQVAVSLTAS